MYTRNQRRAGLTEPPVILWDGKAPSNRRPSLPASTPVSAESNSPSNSPQPASNTTKPPSNTTQAPKGKSDAVKVGVKSVAKPLAKTVVKPVVFRPRRGQAAVKGTPALDALKAAFPDAAAAVEALLYALPSTQKIADLERAIAEESAAYTTHMNELIVLAAEEDELQMKHGLLRHVFALEQRERERDRATARVWDELGQIHRLEVENAKKAKALAAQQAKLDRTARLARSCKRKVDQVEQQDTPLVEAPSQPATKRVRRN